MITPRRAPVRPRVLAPETHETVLLEDLVALCLEDTRQAIEIVGGPRSGKSAALAHLASLPIAEGLLLVDDATRDVSTRKSDRVIVYTARQSLKLGNVSCRLAPWRDDDLIEYLLAVHPDRCSSVMARFLADRDRRLLDGKPELYRVVAEQMARNDDISDVRTALRREMLERAGDIQTLRDVRLYATALLLQEYQLAGQLAGRLAERDVPAVVLRLPLSYRFVQVLQAADQIAAGLHEARDFSFPSARLPRDLVAETAKLIAGDALALRRLQELANGRRPGNAAMAASILLASDRNWRPERDRCPNLRGAYLSEAQWAGINRSHVTLREADLNRADLREADLRGSQLGEAVLRRCRLAKARLEKVKADGADFSHADLSRAVMTDGRFLAARFVQSRLDEVSAPRANFCGAEFEGASLVAAGLDHCDFRGANLLGADFQQAKLRGANLSDQRLRDTNFQGADLTRAKLSSCDLEYVELPAARFGGADLTHAWLTGSVMTRADFRNARLCGAGLADIQWEQADLRGADLRQCSFHLGSSRSGLVGSPYPCHGSRTGFYTNDYDEQSYKAPEEIRKANLCGADLRGARVEGVDFYLVDLRGAKYDATQAAHFRRCDAILAARSVD
ncbi:MAG: pentapeptide repeat-containing protein [Planctomycetes bacterium]|nr:pentapeptide repeat-containing protein [Planctomycetota bacterium]